MVRPAPSLTLLPLFVVFLTLCPVSAVAEHEEPCKVIPLKSRAEIRAGTVFSGTVVSFLFRKRAGGDDSSGSGHRLQLPPRQYAARVVVKRVFKGDHRGLRGRSVIVEGLGNPKICVSRPRLGDARISFADGLLRSNTHFLYQPLHSEVKDHQHLILHYLGQQVRLRVTSYDLFTILCAL